LQILLLFLDYVMYVYLFFIAAVDKPACKFKTHTGRYYGVGISAVGMLHKVN